MGAGGTVGGIGIAEIIRPISGGAVVDFLNTNAKISGVVEIVDSVNGVVWVTGVKVATEVVAIGTIFKAIAGARALARPDGKSVIGARKLIVKNCGLAKWC